jgi:hypothetical protein
MKSRKEAERDELLDRFGPAGAAEPSDHASADASPASRLGLHGRARDGDDDGDGDDAGSRG